MLDMKEQVELVIEQYVAPALKAHGGSIEIVEINEGVVKVRLKGACQGCPHSALTLYNGVRTILIRHIPEIHTVEQVS